MCTTGGLVAFSTRWNVISAPFGDQYGFWSCRASVVSSCTFAPVRSATKMCVTVLAAFHHEYAIFEPSGDQAGVPPLMPNDVAALPSALMTYSMPLREKAI